MNIQDDIKETAERLKQFRKAIGLSQEKFSKELGFSKPAYVRYESGKREVPSRMMRIMFEKFNLSIAWLLFGEGEMFFPEDAERPHVPRGFRERAKLDEKYEDHIDLATLIQIPEVERAIYAKLDEIKRIFGKEIDDFWKRKEARMKAEEARMKTGEESSRQRSEQEENSGKKKG